MRSTLYDSGAIDVQFIHIFFVDTRLKSIKIDDSIIKHSESRLKSKQPLYSHYIIHIYNTRLSRTKRREKPANPADSMPFEVPFSEYNHDSLAIWIDYAKRLNHRLIEITDGSPVEFVDGLCRQFMSDLDVEPLKALSKKCNDILNAINLCQKKVRQLAGVGSQLDSIVETSHSLQKIIGWIEEIKGVIIIDESCVFNIYADNQFTFQEVLPTYINS